MEMYFYKIDDSSPSTDSFINAALDDYLSKNKICLSDKTVYRTQNGKPYFAGDKVFVSVTHSKDTLIIALDKKNFGIDCEKIANHNVNGISSRFFLENEQLLIADAEDKLLAFLTIWTKKEAYIKCLGETFALLPRIDTTKISGFETFIKDDCVITLYTP